MMNVFRLSLRALLAALIVLTSVGMGIARGQAPVADHVVLCGSFGVETVAVDADGNVLTAPGHCPDCAGMMLAVAAPPPSSPVRAGRYLFLSAPLVALPGAIPEAALLPPARAPPSGSMA